MKSKISFFLAWCFILLFLVPAFVIAESCPSLPPDFPPSGDVAGIPNGDSHGILIGGTTRVKFTGVNTFSDFCTWTPGAWSTGHYFYSGGVKFFTNLGSDAYCGGVAGYTHIHTDMLGSSITTDPETECPPCDLAEVSSQAAVACGDASRVASVDAELCTFSCVPCDQIAADCDAQCSATGVKAFSCTQQNAEDGSISGLTVDQECQCNPDCDADRANCNASCGGSNFVLSFDCDTGDCQCRDKNCNDLLNDCIASCNGGFQSFACDDASGTATATLPCTCDDGDVQEDTNNPPDDPDNTNPGENQPETDDTDTGLLEKIVRNTAITSENVRALNDTVGRELNELNRTAENTNTQIRNTNNKLDKISDQLGEGFELTGSASLPGDNTYDSAVTQPEENSLTDLISSYISSGLPLQQFIDDSGFSVSGADSSLSCNLWGSDIDFDISPMESTLHWMGLVIFSISTISAFMIVIKR